MSDIKKILVIIPTYNEAENIDTVVIGIEHVAEGMFSYGPNLLIIDDNSQDGTGERVKALQNQYGNIHLLTGKKEGLGKAYIRSFHYALNHEVYDAFIMMDADLSHDPKDIPALLDALYSGADYVIGSRYVTGSTISRDWPGSRRVASRMANVVARVLTGTSKEVTDLTGGFKAIRREALEEIDLNRLHASGYIFQVSLLHAFIKKGYRIREVPITFSNRKSGKSKLRIRDVTEAIYQVYKLNPNATLQRIVRFGIVGACGTVVNLVILTLLIKLGHIDALIADAIAIEGSIIFNFFLNHTYTFKGYGAYSSHVHRTSMKVLYMKLVKFNLGALGGALISFSMFTLLYRFFHVPYIPADLVAVIIAMSWNYWMSTRFVWRAIDEETISD